MAKHVNLKTKPPMKLICAIYAKSIVRGKLSLNNRDLSEKIGFKRPNLMVLDPMFGNLSF